MHIQTEVRKKKLNHNAALPLGRAMQYIGIQ